MRAARQTAPGVGLLASAAAMLASTGLGLVMLWRGDHAALVGVMLAQAGIYAYAAWSVLRSPGARAGYAATGNATIGGAAIGDAAIGDARFPDAKSTLGATSRGESMTVALVVGVAVVMRLMLLPAPPLSTDVYRYVWDGRVQAAGINPYRHVPGDAALAGLRDDAIYRNINRADYAPTIYPPMAQFVFLAVTRVSETVTAMKAAMVGFELLGVWALLRLLAARGLPARRLLIYLWHPLPLWEFAGSGHVDAAAIALMLLAAWLAHGRAPALAGMALAAGTLVKFVPAVTAPALWRPWDWRFPLAFGLTVVALYVPYLGVGGGVLGFLPGYAQEEGLAGGTGFFLLALAARLVALPAAATGLYLATGAAVLAAIGLAALLRAPDEVPRLDAAMLLLVAFTLIVSPRHPWYFTWAIPFLCFRPSAGLMFLSCAAPLLYGLVWAVGTDVLNAALYGPFAFIVIIETLARRLAGGLGAPTKELPHERQPAA